MRRTPAELRVLADCTQVVLVLAGLVVLALPWWLVYGDGGPDTLLSGWAGLSRNPHNQGLVLVAALVIGTVTTLLRVRVVCLVASALFVVGALVAGIGARGARSSFPGGDVLAATWVGVALVVLAAAQQLGVAALARTRGTGRED